MDEKMIFNKIFKVSKRDLFGEFSKEMDLLDLIDLINYSDELLIQTKYYDVIKTKKKVSGSSHYTSAVLFEMCRDDNSDNYIFTLINNVDNNEYDCIRIK